jgi:2-keto-4-pentenoate hydratase/2-oxohepta-3-ene-1,7-dioic acid hydratase in catechol pathway
VVEGQTIRDVTAALDVLPAQRYPFPRHDLLVEHLDLVVERARSLAPGAPSRPVDSVRLLSPVADPGKVIAAPVNYEKHLHEARTDTSLHGNSPANLFSIHTAGLFLKSATSLVGPGEGIVIRRPDRRTDHEVELVVVIGRRADRVSAVDAMQHVAGYAIGLDISIRGTEDRSFRKSPDTYTVLGPWLVTADEIPDPGSLDLEIAVNGQTRQSANTSQMILGVPQLVELASSMYTLSPGDLIFTGTPQGVSPIQPGDLIVATIARIGSMSVAVHAASVESAPAMTTSSAGA